eukprot:scaffold72635_cov55-Attheya_sp.AAC.1
MAHQQANAGGAPQAVPPVGAPGPVAPQLPYAADPGTITGWLVRESAASTADSLSDEIEAVTQRYAGLPA